MYIYIYIYTQRERENTLEIISTRFNILFQRAVSKSSLFMYNDFIEHLHA